MLELRNYLKKYSNNKKILENFLKKKLEKLLGVKIKAVKLYNKNLKIEVYSKQDEINLFKKKSYIVSFVNSELKNWGEGKEINSVFVFYKFSAFTLLEIIIVIGVVSILMIVLLNIFFFFIKQQRISQLNFILSSEGKNFLMKFYSLPIYKPDFYDYGVRREEGCDSPNNTGNNFLRDINGNIKNYHCDIGLDYGNSGKQVIKFIPNYLRVKELYLINRTGDEKYFFRLNFGTGFDYNRDGKISDNEKLITLQSLFLKGFDVGIGKTYDFISSGLGDGIIDSRFCDYGKKYLCSGNSISNFIYSGYKLPVGVDDGWRDFYDFKGLTITGWNVEFYTGIDTSGWMKIDFKLIFYLPYWKNNYPPSMMKNLFFPIEIYIPY